MKYKIKYHHSYQYFDLDESRITGVIENSDPVNNHTLSEQDIVEDALNHPIDSIKLTQIVENKEHILIITSDHTRPLPSAITLPLLLSSIRSANPDAKIKILIATGCHRRPTHSEMIDKFAKEVVENEEFIIHYGGVKEDMVFKGVLPSGGALWVNKLVDWQDVMIAEGFIEPHFFAGFSGGRKSVLPGISYKDTVFGNHCSKMLASPHARAGNLRDNPIHEDMIFAAHKVGLDFILNVILDADKNIISAFAGNPISAHIEGCNYMRGYASKKAVKSDIVIVSNGGYPLDQNIYQSVKGLCTANSCTNDNGVIIMVASCFDGHGGEDFYHWIKNGGSPKDILKEILQIPQDKTRRDQWQVQKLAEVMACNTIIIVSDMCDPDIISNMHMLHARNVTDALMIAENIKGDKAAVTIIQDGVSVIISDN